MTRCALCPVGITRDEFNDYFAKATGGACENIGWKIPVQSVRSAWEYVHANKLPIVSVEASESDIDWTLPVPGMPKKRAEFMHTSERSHRRSNAPKKQQGLVSIIRQIVESAHEPLVAATIRVALDESGDYEFKKGVEGWRRTNQIHSAIANHIKTHGESAMLCKTADGKITIR